MAESFAIGVEQCFVSALQLHSPRLLISQQLLLYGRSQYTTSGQFSLNIK